MTLSQRFRENSYLFHEVGWVARALWKDRKGLLSSTLIMVLVVILLTIWNARSQQPSTSYHTSSVLLNLAISILAALGVDILVQWHRIWDRRRTQRHFCTFFGIPEMGSSVAVVLSRFEGSMEYIKTKQMAAWNFIGGNWDDPVGSSALPDLLAAKDIIAAFSEMGFPTPTIIWDDEAVKFASDPTGPYDVLITIGLFSNDMLKWLNDRGNRNRVFLLSTLQPKEQDGQAQDTIGIIKLLSYKDGAQTDKIDHWEVFQGIPNVLDRALVARVKLQPQLGGKTIFVLGGIETEGTQAIGNYLRHTWRSLMARHDRGNDKNLTDDDFAIIVDVPLNKSGQTISVQTLRVS